MNILAICGSLRKKSTNMGLLRYAQTNAPAGSTITIADLSAVPFYNADLTEKPASVVQLLQQLQTADALILGCPEYNYSIAPALKNALDWASREPENALLNGKPVALMGAGGGMGTSRAQYHLRQVCVYLNLHPLNKPEVFANAFTNAFDADGNLVDEKIQGNIKAQLASLVEWTAQLKK
ncbi:NADPH-dependent FMN reductase [Cellvibrio sp. pealriver]|uniref:NADPH-dependent FMN reductase n=1 Tax=Cellvibrio sp. pealriver TaxID=1622269 RepID=UPI00066FBF3D|nr:NADPH-dependent FMN reductase [Cellvibrio sp. pealriver]